MGRCNSDYRRSRR